MPYGYQDQMHNGWGAGGIAMIVMMVVFVVAVVAVIWFIVNGQRRPGRTDAAAVRATPEQILGERLARGEINADEYRARLAALKDHAA